jgi:hypothetical protein
VVFLVIIIDFVRPQSDPFKPDAADQEPEHREEPKPRSREGGRLGELAAAALVVLLARRRD